MKKVLDFFLYSNIYISVCALVMSYQTFVLFQLTLQLPFLAFVFFATLCSYNFHWYFTESPLSASKKLNWSYTHKSTHVLFFVAGLIGLCWWGYALKEIWTWLIFGALIAFIYSAPKIPQQPFLQLKRFVVGKTIFLALAWSYVTVVLPLVLTQIQWTIAMELFAINRFFLIYAICILFDYRDRKEDRAEGIRSLVTEFDEPGINQLFRGSLVACIISTGALYFTAVSLPVLAILLLPAAILWTCYASFKNKPTDYRYYLVLDGLLMLSGLFLLITGLP